MEVIIKHKDDDVVAVLSGDFDLYAVKEFSATMNELFKNEIRHLYVDMQNVHYLDSSGVGAIIRILQTAKSRNFQAIFSGIAGTPKKVLELANILPLMQLQS